MSLPTADNIVFNLTLFNDQNTSIPAEIYLSRDQAFISNTENYYLRLINAQISTTEIPLFTYKNDMFVEIESAGISTKLLVTFPVLFNSVPNNIVFLQQFLNGVNNTLALCHNDVGAPGNPPLLIYDKEEIKLVVDQNYDPDVQFISFNDILINKMPSMMTTYNNTTELYQLIYGQFGTNVYDSYPGGINYPIYIMSSNALGYAALQEFLSMVVVSRSMSVNKQQINNNSISGRILGIIDVIPLVFEDVTKSAVKLYNQDYPVYCDLLSNGKLSEVDFKIYLIDANYNLQDLTIQPRTSVTCRFEFVNKKIVKNYYPSG